MNTNFQKVLEFNKSFGVNYSSEPNREIFQNKDDLNYRFNLVKEEFEELKEACDNEDFVETVDALADILYVVYGFFGAIGVDADKAFDIVHKSNMSKLCSSEDEAKKTVQSYLDDPQKRYTTPTYRLSNDKKNFIVYNKETSKILKNVNYFPTEFSSVI